MASVEEAGWCLLPWSAGFLAGYVLITSPVAGGVAIALLISAGLWGSVRAVRSGRRVKLPCWYGLVAFFLAVSGLLGVAGGAGLAAHGFQWPWEGLGAAALAWAAARAGKGAQA